MEDGSLSAELRTKKRKEMAVSGNGGHPGEIEFPSDLVSGLYI